MPKTLSIPRQITQFKQKEINALFKRARYTYSDDYFQVRQSKIDKHEINQNPKDFNNLSPQNLISNLSSSQDLDLNKPLDANQAKLSSQEQNLEKVSQNSKQDQKDLSKDFLSSQEIKKDNLENIIGKILIITPKKSGKAHERNLLRRRIKAIFYENQLYMVPLKTIIYCKKGSTHLKFEQIKDFLLKVIR